MNNILIPTTKLVEGFESCREQIIILLSDSKELYRSRKFISSIALSILAHEEVGKLNIIRTHILSQKGITKKEWEETSKPGSHTYKATTFYGIALNDLKKMGEKKYNQIIEEEKRKGSYQKFHSYSDIIKHESIMRKHFKILNEIKKACLYVDWKDSNWFTISKIYSEHELKLLANYLLDLVGYELVSEILTYKYPSDFYHQIPAEISIMRKDPLWHQREEYSKRIYDDKEYQKFLDAINYLIDTFPKKSFKFVK